MGRKPERGSWRENGVKIYLTRSHLTFGILLD
jgi:hypothetical protein